MPSQKGNRRLRTLSILVGVFFFLLICTYFLIQSPTFLKYLIKQANYAMSGEIQYKSLTIDLNRRSFAAEDLIYLNEQGEKILWIKSVQFSFAFTGALKGRLDITQLQASHLMLDLKVIKESHNPISWKTILRLISKRISIHDGIIDPVDIRLKNGMQIQLSEIQLGITPQILEEQKVHVRASQTTSKLKTWVITTRDFDFDGEINIPLLGDYSFFVDEALGKFQIGSINIDETLLGDISGSVSVNGDKLALSEALFTSVMGPIGIQLHYQPKKDQIQTRIQTRKSIEFAKIPGIYKRIPDTFETVDLDLDLDIEGTSLEDLKGDIKLLATSFGNKSNPETPEQKLNLKGKIHQGSLALQDFQIQSNKMSLDGKGSIDFANQKFDVKINTKSFDLTTLLSCLSDLDLTGYVDADGSIGGTFKNPSFIFNGYGLETGYKFLHFGRNNGIFKIVDGVLSYEGKNPPGTDYSANVSVKTQNIFKRDSRKTNLTSTFNNFDATHLLDNPSFNGKISGSFDMEALPGGTKNGRLLAQIQDFILYDFHIGELSAEGNLQNGRFVLENTSFQPPKFQKVLINEKIVFVFDDKGFTVEGKLLPGASIDGKYSYASPFHFIITSDLKNAELSPVLAAMTLDPTSLWADGRVKMDIGLENTPSKIDIDFTRLLLPFEGGEIREDGPIAISVTPPHILLKQVGLRSNDETFQIGGKYSLDGVADLTLSGKLDLNLLKLFDAYFREGSGFARLALKILGTAKQPNVTGDIEFLDSAILLRAFRERLENLKGTLHFTPGKVALQALQGSIGDGDFNASGEVTLKGLTPQFYDISLLAKEIAISEPTSYQVAFSGDFFLKGPSDKALLSGHADITEGRYIQDFNISQFIIKPQAKPFPGEKNPFLENLFLDLKIKNPGELVIKNNIAKIFLKTDLSLKGKASQPEIGGSLEVLEGEFHYFKVDFENAKGLIDFRDPGKGPYVDISAKKTFERSLNNIDVTAQIKGFTDNLHLSFLSDPPLEKREILSLIFTGHVPGEGAGLSGTNIASSVLVSQIGALIQRPVEQNTQIDIFRLEASDPTHRSLTTLVVGKRLTERLSFELKTDLGIEEPLQGIQMEYLLLDNMLFKASQQRNGDFEFNLALRWRLF